MADIFLSYSREDRAAVEPLAERLIAAGYSVWWDRNLSGGTRYLKETEAELQAAKVVLVVWSNTSIESHWVADEASAGRDTGRLLPISLDGSIPPLGFRQFQVIDFAKWTRDDGAALKQLIAALARITTPSSEPNQIVADSIGKSRRLAMGGVAFAVVALIATTVYFLNRADSTASVQNYRTAFFGFTASDDGPLSTQVAIAATDETYTTLTALGVDTAARGESQGVELKQQMATSLALGARYGLAGTVRTQGDSVTVSIRLDDTNSRATFWQATLIGDKLQASVLSTRAAARGTNLLYCITRLGADLEPISSTRLGIASRACDAGTTFERDTALRWRELTNVAPKSAYAQLGLARSLVFFGVTLPQEEQRSAILAEYSEAVSKALTLDPKNAEARARSASLKFQEGRPLSEYMKELDDAAALALKTGDRRGASAIAGFKTLALAALGQAGTALPEARLAKQGDPLSPLTSVSYAQALAGAGRVEESVNVLEEANARLQDGMVWRTLVPFALMVDADRANRAIDERPASTRDETYACWRQIIAAMKTADLQIRRSVVAQLATCNLLGMNLLPHVMLDNLDGAFGYLQRQQRRTEPLDIPSSLQMFLLPARKLRADPRFLQIVKDRGIYQYWLDSGTHPSVCDAPEERDFPVCVELRKDQGK